MSTPQKSMKRRRKFSVPKANFIKNQRRKGRKLLDLHFFYSNGNEYQSIIQRHMLCAMRILQCSNAIFDKIYRMWQCGEMKIDQMETDGNFKNMLFKCYVFGNRNSFQFCTSRKWVFWNSNEWRQSFYMQFCWGIKNWVSNNNSKLCWMRKYF